MRYKMDAAIDMYYFTTSPPSRAVMLLARFIGLTLNLKLINIMKGEQMKPDFLKLNPMHTVPTMDDNGFVLWESHAIMQYLVDKYDKQGKLVFTDPKEKAIINKLLYWDSATFFDRLLGYLAPVVIGGQTPNQEKKAKLEDALRVLNQLLENNEWAAGNRMSIADFSLIAGVSTCEAIGIDISKYDNVMAWYGRTKKALAETGYMEINQKATDMINKGFNSAIKSG